MFVALATAAAVLFGALLFGALVLGLGVRFGGPRAPVQEMPLGTFFCGTAFADLPQASPFTARDGSSLAFRAYPPLGMRSGGSVLLLHGLGASGQQLHRLARALCSAGLSAYVLDIRGHGASGPRGCAAHAGQLEDDIEDLARHVRLPEATTLLGYDAGATLALRIALGPRRALFSDYLFLAPLFDATCLHEGAYARIASTGSARMAALGLLRTLGLRAFDAAPCGRLRLGTEAAGFFTTHYRYGLWAALQALDAGAARVRTLSQPARVLVGEDDQLVDPGSLSAALAAGKGAVPVKQLPGIDHWNLVLDPVALGEVVFEVRLLAAARRAGRDGTVREAPAQDTLWDL